MDSYHQGQEIARIMTKMGLGTATAEEKRLLDSWLEASPRNRAVYEEFISGRGREVRDMRFAGIDDGLTLRGVRAKIGRYNNRRRLLLRLSGAAAVIAACCVAALSLTDLRRDGVPVAQAPEESRYEAVMTLGDGSRVVLSDPQGETEWQTHLEEHAPAQAADGEPVNVRISVPKGKEYKIRLSDGSVVWLNGETTIDYPDRFTGPVRGVRICGEAFFEVAHDPAHPFEATTPDALSVRVLGTRFNLQSYPDVPDVQVTLLDGAVAVGRGSEKVNLAPNQQARFDRTTGAIGLVAVADASAHIAWIQGMFSFDEAPVADVLSQVAAWYGYEVVYENPGEIHPGHLTLHAGRNRGMDGLMELVRSLTGMEYRIDGHTVYVRF